MDLQDLVLALVIVALRGGTARVRINRIAPRDMLAFHLFRTRWPPSSRIRWADLHDVN